MSWVLASQVSTLPLLYLTYGLLGGIGTGHRLRRRRWPHGCSGFPDKRGLATGLVAAGYGVGALLTTFRSRKCCAKLTYQHALLNLRAHLCGRAG
jgi:hypothetical protein